MEYFEERGLRFAYSPLPVDLVMAMGELSGHRPGILSRAADIEEDQEEKEE